MRPIDADALKELFSEVIGHIAKKPEMNGNLEHMIRASAMVIQMIDDAPTVQPYTTTHDSIPAETGKNDGDGTSGDCISRRQAIYIASGYCHPANIATELAKLPSVQPEIIRCKDCKHKRFFDPCFYCYEMGGEIIVPENGFCFKAERREK